MALNYNTLVTEFRKLMDPDYAGFLGHPATKALAAQNFKNAYHAYAGAAVDKSGDSLASSNPAGFQSALTFNTTTPALAAAEFGAAFLAYWTGATFAVGVPPAPSPTCPNVGGNLIWGVEQTSMVTVVNNVPLIAALTIEFAVQSLDGNAKAQAIANIFHATTITHVTVLIAGLDTTVPTPLPITNTCTVF